MQSGNPALSHSVFLDAGSGTLSTSHHDAMTVAGTVNKTFFLLFLVVFTAAGTWMQLDLVNNPGGAMPYIIGGAIGGLVLALITVFKPQWAHITAPAYAVVEGLFIGAVSAMYEMQYPGIVLQAAGLTFATMAAMLMAYRSGIIQATEGFKAGVVAATGGICLVYLVSIVMNLFGVQMPYIHESGPIGIAFSLFVVTIAALNLVLDFDLIEQGVNSGAPKQMEWYGAFGLTVTLVWLYIEFLRLLSKLRE
jgi:uncharacterized YccA/Bax inhibitor family protein